MNSNNHITGSFEEVWKVLNLIIGNLHEKGIDKNQGTNEKVAP